MFDGNTFLPVTGTPMRKMACMIRPLADADPVPLAVAILKAKSLTRVFIGNVTGRPERQFRRLAPDGLQGNECGARVRILEHVLAHVPRIGRAALGAEPAMEADVLVLHHQA